VRGVFLSFTAEFRHTVADGIYLYTSHFVMRNNAKADSAPLALGSQRDGGRTNLITDLEDNFKAASGDVLSFGAD
jgi:hypothetical protein